MTLRLGLIGYGAIGRHVEAALKGGQIENIDLVTALVRRPRDGAPLLTHEPERFFAQNSMPWPSARDTKRSGPMACAHSKPAPICWSPRSAPSPTTPCSRACWRPPGPTAGA